MLKKYFYLHYLKNKNYLGINKLKVLTSLTKKKLSF